MIQIKGNQPKLLALLQACHQAQPTPAGAWQRVSERRSGCQHSWQVSVQPCPAAVQAAGWVGAARLVVVVKTVGRPQAARTQTHYYLTSLRTTPLAELAQGIRGHWGIENKLHRSRDLYFGQDGNGIRHPVAAANMALFNTMALNYLLGCVHSSVTYAQLYFAQNFKQNMPTPRT